MALPAPPVLPASRVLVAVPHRWAWVAIVLCVGCTETEEVQVPPGCGDGLPDADEACDDGAANSNTEADACRVTCVLAACGDGVVDNAEACDDGGRLGGDGCDPACGAEIGTLEAEPNDVWDLATPAAPPGTTPGGTGDVAGSLSAEDVDCWSFPVARCDAITVTESAPCTRGLSLTLHDPTGALLAVGAPGETGGCTGLDPADQPGARWVAEGTWAVCASAAAPVDGYALTIAVGASTGLAAPLDGSDDDGDGAPESCDTDTDGDGVDNLDDDCPDVSNGPETPVPSLSADGFVTDWLAVGPFVGGVSTLDCRPSEDAFVGEDEVGEDTAIAPVMGDPAGGLFWTAWVLDSNSFDLLNFASVGAPREAYALVYLESPTARTLTLAVGADDGVFAWWNGVQVMDVSACQGVNADQFTASVEARAGMNTLLFKVRDQGGGWGLAARFYEADGARVSDLVPSLSPAGGWAPGQSDRDGDGIGDYCDSEP